MEREAMIRSPLMTALAATVAAGLSSAPSAFARDDSDQRLGTVHFMTSCNETAQRRFDRGMRYQHSFWYRQAGEIFEDVAKADSECGMAFWGIALTLLNNPHGAPPASNLPLGLAAIQKAKAVGAKTQRERDYIDALAVMYVDYDKIDHRSRVQAYLKAMEALAGRYPEDDEAQIAYAITLNVAASPADKTYANQLKGAAILEPIFKRQPRHPGVAHYLIHLYDYPPIAEKGLDAAKRYAQIAPAAPHAQHMPSHIFTRVGYWKESIASNIASARAAKADKEWDDEMLGTQGYKRFAGFYARAASQARYVVERGDWKGASELQLQPSPIAYADAVTHFARALGAARSGHPEAAKADIAKLAELRDKLSEAKDAYWSEIVDIQREVATAWTLYAEGKYDEALAAMSAASDREDKTEKHPVTPGPLAPARELYGTMLLDRGMAKEALAAFESTLKKEPNRLGATLGAGAAAERSGNSAKAREHYAAAVALTENADPVRAQIAQAREFVTRSAR